MRVLALGLAVLGLSGPAGWAAPDIAGRWEGAYACGRQAESRMALTIERPVGGRASGVFEFDINGRKGRYAVSGAVDGAGEFRFAPREWLVRPSGVTAVSIHGRVSPDGAAIEGRMPECGSGSFRAARSQERAAAPPARPPGPKGFPRSPAEWVAAVEAETARLAAEKAKPHLWSNLLIEVRLGSPHGVDRAVKAALIRDIELARAKLLAEPLLESLKAAPSFDERGLGAVLRVADSAAAANWPDEVKSMVREAARARAAEILRPKLQAVGGLAPNLPSSLAGLIAGRAALEPVMEYSASMVGAFGSLDPEGALIPMWRRLVEIERDPAVQRELRDALAAAAAAGAAEPDLAIEDLLRRALGSGPYATAINALVEEAREQARAAKIAEAAEKVRPLAVVEAVIGGEIQTHADLPERAPMAYAMRHEFLDALVALCGAPSGPGYSAAERELMDQWISIHAIVALYGARGGSGVSFAEAAIAVLADPLSKLAAPHMIRLDIAKDPQGLVRDVVAALGGCGDERVDRLKNGLAAIAAMGPTPSPEARLVETRVSPAGDLLTCFYSDPERRNFRFHQSYTIATPVTPFNYVAAIRAGPAPLRRLHCPSLPDPAVEMDDERIHLRPDNASLPQGDRAERLAAAFLDQYVPGYVARADGSPFVLDPELRARYFEAIVKFERIVVTPGEIRRTLREREDAIARRQPIGSPREAAVELDLRLAKFNALHGGELWAVIEEAVAVAGDHGANYLAVRPNAEFFELVR